MTYNPFEEARKVKRLNDLQKASDPDNAELVIEDGDGFIYVDTISIRNTKLDLI